jgi:DNA-directed RNA polymerase subunit RPC12/RpoP
MILGDTNSYDEPWPPIICHACGGRMAESESNIKGYLMCECKKCGHRIYQHVKGNIFFGKKDA